MAAEKVSTWEHYHQQEAKKASSSSKGRSSGAIRLDPYKNLQLHPNYGAACQVSYELILSIFSLSARLSSFLILFYSAFIATIRAGHLRPTVQFPFRFHNNKRRGFWWPNLFFFACSCSVSCYSILLAFYFSLFTLFSFCTTRPASTDRTSQLVDWFSSLLCEADDGSFVRWPSAMRMEQNGPFFSVNSDEAYPCCVEKQESNRGGVKNIFLKKKIKKI